MVLTRLNVFKVLRRRVGLLPVCSVRYENGPDLDIGNSPVLHSLPDGGSIVVAGTKDGKVFALEPDKRAPCYRAAGCGGSIASIGPTIANGMLFIGSGYGVISGNVGNVLPALGIE
jgi:outer membrane protein assembly factor BamB